MVTETDVRIAIFRTLSSPAAQKIDFTLGSVTIDGAGLMTVAGLAMAGMLPVAVKAQPSGAAASYNTHSNTVSVPPGFNPASVGDRSSLLHECSHALMDIYWGGMGHSKRGWLVTTESENEAAAYVAGSLYQIYETGSPPASSVDIFIKANTIASSLKGRSGVKVSVADELNLRNAIAAHPVYKNSGMHAIWTLSKANGI